MAPAPAVARLYWGADTAGRVPLPGPSLHSTCTCAQPALLATRLRPGTAALLHHGAPLQLPCSPLSAGPSIPPRCTTADSEPGCPSARYSLCPGSPFALDASARPAWSDSAGRRPSPRGASARSRPETERLATPQLFSGHPRWQVAFLSALGFSFVVLAREWRPEFWERLSSPHTLRKRSWGGGERSAMMRWAWKSSVTRLDRAKSSPPGDSFEVNRDPRLAFLWYCITPLGSGPAFFPKSYAGTPSKSDRPPEL